MEIVFEINISIPRWIKNIKTGLAAIFAHENKCKTQKSPYFKRIGFGWRMSPRLMSFPSFGFLFFLFS